ncbi:MAG: FAD-binding protein [Verrucomicrobia bacterium]|nr:FAD-binding protein [Verrucomicrobiota bacterium]
MSFAAELQKLIGKGRVRMDDATLEAHSSDEWFASHRPDAVVFAENARMVSHVMRFASRHKVPVTVRGGGVGYVGGCVPVRGGIALSLARMNRILEIHPEDGVATVEAGVVTGDLQAATRRHGWFYPPDPASLKECTIGGNISTNAGGPRCLKYGVTRHYVLGLQVVLPTGEIIQAGGRTHKNKTGFDLVGLFVGSEGLLGVVTQATLRLIPHPPARACLSAGFADERHAAAAVQLIFKKGFLPSAVEIADGFTLDAVRRKFSGTAEKPLSFQDDGPVSILSLPHGQAHLLVETDGQRSSVRAELKALARLLRTAGALSLDTAETEKDCERLWELRREFSRALKSTGLRKLNEDIAVPRSRLVDLFEFAKKLQRRHGIRAACFGHAGDGNIHVNLMVDDHVRRQVIGGEHALNELFRQVLKWKGAITGEHGIGLAKKRWWSMAIGPDARKLHERLKSCLDPAGVLNPGKFVGK